MQTPPPNPPDKEQPFLPGIKDQGILARPGNFHTVVNTFTQGLRELPTDYVTRVKSFLTEYLGSTQHPVPFGGRLKDFAYLDDWLADSQAPPYLLLAAPAGRGKSALLVRWCQRLFMQQDVAVAYFPVSIRFRTNLAGVSFPSLVALLARLHEEKIPADPNTHDEVWRNLFVDYLTRPLPDGRSLVLVLDGVDEAADWMVGPDLFPLDPPPGLRIVLSARHLVNDEDANGWLKRLGWTRPGLAHTLELYPLDRSGIASVLTQMGFPLDILGTRVNIVSELYRLSEGDPLLVRLYVDDLWERGEAAMRFRPEDLRAIRPGLAGYFERWWKDQRLLWSKEAPQREAAAQKVLNLLAVALGPLSREDIFSLLPGPFPLDSVGVVPRADPDVYTLPQGGRESMSFLDPLEGTEIAPLARFVTGDGIRQGYVFSHPRLGNYFREEHLSETERQEIEHRFLAWGEQTLAALNEGSLAPENASTYIIQYYGAHLERTQANVQSLLALVSDGWRRAWEKLDRGNAGFLGDVERAWQAAEYEDTAAISTGSRAAYLGEQIRCLLSQVSVNSVTSNISPRLMLEAVKTGIWTPAQGLACIRLITNLAARARELVELAPYVQEPLRANILQEALDTVMTIKDEYARLDALIELASRFSEDLLWQVLEIIPTIEDEADRAGALTELAPSLSPYQALLEKALDLVQEMEEEEYRALALEGLAPHCFVDQHDRVLQIVRIIQEERYRTQTLIALIPSLAERFPQEFLQQASSIQDGLLHMRLLTKLATHLPEQLKAEAVEKALELERDIDDREYRIEMLVELAPFLPTTKLQETLQQIQRLWDDSYRARALKDLIQYLPEELLPEFLQLVRAIKNDEHRTKVLIQLLPRLPKDLLEPVLDTAQVTWDEGCQVELLAKLAPYTSEVLLPRLREIVTKIEDQGYCVWLLAELKVSLGEKLPEEDVNRLDALDYMHDKEERLQTLLAILPRLSEGALSKIFSFMLPELFDFSWHVRSEGSRAHILTKLGSRLPENWLPTAMESVRAMQNELHQVQVLLALVALIRETQFSETLDIVRSMKDKEKRAQVLVALVTSLPEEHKGEKIQEMLQVLQTIKDEPERVHVIIASAPYLPGTLPTTQAEMLIKLLQEMLGEHNQIRIWKALALHMPEVLLEETLEVTQTLQSEEERADMLETLVPLIPQRSFPRLLSIVDAMQDRRWRVQTLTTVLSHAPQSIIMDMLANLPSRLEVLRALVMYTPQNALHQLWEATRIISDTGMRLLVLAQLAPRMPEEFFVQIWEEVQRIPSIGWQSWLLRALAPHISETLFPRVWQAVLAIHDKEKRLQMFVALAPHVPERFFSEVWKVVQTLPDKKRWQLLEALTPSVPKEFFSQFFNAVEAISYPEVRVQALLALIPHMPDGFFSQLWKVVEAMENERHQAKMLIALATHIPTDFFPSAWEMMQYVKDATTQTQILKALLPHLPQEMLAETIKLVQVLPYGEMQIDILETLVPCLSEEMCTEMFAKLVPTQSGERLAEIFTQTTWDTRYQTRTLAVLIPYLPEERLQSIVPAVLKAIRVLRVEEDQVWLLRKLASNMPETLLQEMLDTLWSLNTMQSQAEVLAALFQTLSQAKWVKVLELLTVKVKATGKLHFAVEALKAANHLVQQSSPALLYPALREILHLMGQCTRRDALINLAHLAPAIRIVGGEEAIMETCHATLEVGCWWP